MSVRVLDVISFCAITYKACLVEFIGVVADYNGNVLQSRLMTNDRETEKIS